MEVTVTIQKNRAALDKYEEQHYPELEDGKFKDSFSHFRSERGQREFNNYWLVQKLAKKSNSLKFAKMSKSDNKVDHIEI